MANPEKNMELQTVELNPENLTATFEALERVTEEVRRLGGQVVARIAGNIPRPYLESLEQVIKIGAEGQRLSLAATAQVAEAFRRLDLDIITRGSQAAEAFGRLDLSTYDAVVRASEVAQEFRALNWGPVMTAAEAYLDMDRGVARRMSEVLGQVGSPALTEALASLRDFSDLAGEHISTALLTLGEAAPSPLIELTTAANASILRVLGALPSQEVVCTALEQVSAGWLGALQPALTAAEAFAGLGSVLSSRLADVSAATILAQSALSRVTMGEIGQALRVSDVCRAAIGDTFLDLTHSYSDLFRFLEDAPLGALSVPPIVTALPPRAFLGSVDLLEAISFEDVGRNQPQHWQRIRERISEYPDEEALPALLSGFGPGFVTMWQGAERALTSNNPDHVRHFAVSWRELFTHVLHRLAPDKAIRAWDRSPELYDEHSQPTRRARLLYICRSINCDPFCAFVEKDIAATLELVDLFQQGTHKVLASYTPAQLKALRNKAESTIRSMILTAQQAAA